MEIGIFGGSFNPIHIGHLALANYLCEYERLDELWFLVSPHNPLKEEKELWQDSIRLELVKTAISDYPRFRASDFEFHLPRPSYMLHTLRKLREQYPEHNFTLIIGSDNWEHFPRWYKHEEILAENKLLIYPRPGFPIVTDKLPTNVRLTNAPLLDISSTFIRESLRKGKDVRYFLPHGVYELIQKVLVESDASKRFHKESE